MRLTVSGLHEPKQFYASNKTVYGVFSNSYLSITSPVGFHMLKCVPFNSYLNSSSKIKVQSKSAVHMHAFLKLMVLLPASQLPWQIAGLRALADSPEKLLSFKCNDTCCGA